MKLLKAMATIASFTMISRVLGMVRDMLTASVLGAGPIADAFFVALKLPNFFRRVSGEGAFSVAFIPLYSQTLEKEGEEAAGKMSGEIFSVMTVVLAVFCVLMMLAMPWVIHLIAPGFNDGSERYDLAVSMTRLSFPYLLLVSLVALFGGVLNAHHKFAPFSAASIIFNVTLIVMMLAFAPFFPTAGHAMAIGVSLSGILQLGMMAYFFRRYKIAFQFQWPRLGEKSKELFKLMGPGFISSGIYQIHLFVSMMMASLLPSGAISYLYYADRLNQLPLGIGGVAVGTALLPMLSRTLSSGNESEGKDLYNRALEFSFFLGSPAAVALLVIPLPIVMTLFQHGNFSQHDALWTSYVLMGYGLGLPAYISSKVFMTAFWARHDTVTPVRISVFMALLNIALSLLFIGLLGVAGIALATGLVGWGQIYLLVREINKRGLLEFDDRLRVVFPKIAICSCFMGIVLSILTYVMHPFFIQALPVKILALVALIGGGIISYAVSVHMTGVLKFSDIKTYLKHSKE